MWQPAVGFDLPTGQPVELSMLRLAAVAKQMMARHPAGSVLISILIVYILRFISRYLHRSGHFD